MYFQSQSLSPIYLHTHTHTPHEYTYKIHTYHFLKYEDYILKNNLLFPIGNSLIIHPMYSLSFHQVTLLA